MHSKRQRQFQEYKQKFREDREATEVQKEREYDRRRTIRKTRSKLIKSDRRLLLYKKLLFLSCLTLILGIIVTFGSTVRSIGEGSFLWSQRHIFKYAGPCMCGLSSIAMIIGFGLTNKRREKVITQKGLCRRNSSMWSMEQQVRALNNRRKLARQRSTDSDSTQCSYFNGMRSDFSGSVLDMEPFLCNSLSSTSSSMTVGGNSFAFRIATMMGPPIDECMETFEQKKTVGSRRTIKTTPNSAGLTKVKASIREVDI